MACEFQYDVFLSHSAKDKQRVRLLAEKLRTAGLRVWFDEWIVEPGDDIYLAIERGLEGSRSLLLCLSPAALGSDWVGLERSAVLFRDPSNAARRFIPLLLADCNLPDTLRRYKYVDLRQETAGAFEELLSACRVPEENTLILPEPMQDKNPNLAVTAAPSTTQNADRPVVPTKLVLLVHGIRTRARWQKRIVPQLKNANTVVEAIGYGYFNVFEFLSPFLTRKRAIAQVLWRMEKAIDDHPGTELTIIAHSFGTYCVSDILGSTPHIKPKRVILCGSVVDANFRWDQLRQQPQVVNDCGTKDVTGRLKTGHSRALQNRPLQGGLFISVFFIQARGFPLLNFC